MGCNTIEEYLRGKTHFPVPDDAIATILADRGLIGGENPVALDARTRELCVADLYMYCATFPAITQLVEDQSGSWKHREGQGETSEWNAKVFMGRARRIYEKWGEKHGSYTVFKVIKL